MSPKEIKALIYLLEDSDPQVSEHVFSKLISIGQSVIPALEEEWQKKENEEIQQKLEDIIRIIQFEELKCEFETWSKLENPDLLTGAFLVSKYFYPTIKLEDIKKKIYKHKQRIWLDLNYNESALEQVRTFNQIFFSIQGFGAAQSDSLDFKEFCINHLLETKKGNPLSLGILYQIIANDLDLPIYGVALLKSFVLCFCKSNIQSTEQQEKEVLFYLNPVNNGSVFSRNQIVEYLDKLNAPHLPKYFNPTSNTQIVKVLLSTLIEILWHLQKAESANDLKVLLDSLEE